jgi:PAS domain-containing protein
MGFDKDKIQATEPAELRRRAEELLRAKTVEARPPRTEAESQRLLHELEVHRIELEMQNAELRQAREEVETALEKYTDLYEFAPVGYFTLDRDGTIRAANLAGAGLLGVERSRLIDRRFGLFVADEARLLFSELLGKVFASQGKEFCEVTLSREGNPPAHRSDRGRGLQIRARVPRCGHRHFRPQGGGGGDAGKRKAIREPFQQPSRSDAPD